MIRRKIIHLFRTMFFTVSTIYSNSGLVRHTYRNHQFFFFKKPKSFVFIFYKYLYKSYLPSHPNHIPKVCCLMCQKSNKTKRILKPKQTSHVFADWVNRIELTGTILFLALLMFRTSFDRKMEKEK